MEIFKLFPTSVASFDFTDHPDKEILLNYINNLSNLNFHGLVKKGISSFHTPENILDLVKFKNLKKDFQKCVDQYTNALDIQKTKISNSWVNIMEKGGKVKMHHHNSSIVSAAYYPFLKSNSCDLYFKSPLYTSINFTPNTSNGSEHFYEIFKLNIKENHLYLFPGWLEHFTEKNKSEKRIVVSFNAASY